MLGVPIAEAKIVFIPTAANFESGDPSWVNEDINNFKKLGYASVEVVDISEGIISDWQSKFESANALVFGGGNTSYLMYWIRKSGLESILPKLLETRAYVGISAGSCVTSGSLKNPVQDLFEENYYEDQFEGLGYVNFQIVPHLNSEWFLKIREEYLSEVAKIFNETIYAIDDQCAIRLLENKAEIIGDGVSLILNIN